MNELTHKLDKQIHLTDFYLDKILPVQNFTQLMNVIRNIVSNQEQFEKVEEMRKSFFSNFEDDISQISTENEESFVMPTGLKKFGALAQTQDICGGKKHNHSISNSSAGAASKKPKKSKKNDNLSRGSSYYASSFEKESESTDREGW
jgi:hypothetical protein